MPTQLLTTAAPQPPAELQYIQQSLAPPGAYIQYQPAGHLPAPHTHVAAAGGGGAGFAPPPRPGPTAADTYQQPLCMSSIVLTSNGLQGASSLLRFRTLPDASGRFRTLPDASGRFRTLPSLPDGASRTIHFIFGIQRPESARMSQTGLEKPWICLCKFFFLY